MTFEHNTQFWAKSTDFWCVSACWNDILDILILFEALFLMWIFKCNLQFLALNGSFCNTVKHPRTHGEITWSLSWPLILISKCSVFYFYFLWSYEPSCTILKLSPLHLRSLPPPPFRVLGPTPEVSSGLEWIQRTFYSCQPSLHDPCWWHFTYRHRLLSLSWPRWTLPDDTEDTCGVMELDTHDWLHVIFFQHEKGWAASSCVYWHRAGGNSKDAAL